MQSHTLLAAAIPLPGFTLLRPAHAGPTRCAHADVAHVHLAACQRCGGIGRNTPF